MSDTPPAQPAAVPPPPRAAKPRRAAATNPTPPFINLCGDYRFLRAGYWALIDAELNGVRARPSALEALTAQNAAACLLVAKQAGIPTAEWKSARKPEDIEPPSLLVQVAGLANACYQVRTERSRASQLRSASQNGTRPVIAVKLTGPLRRMKTMVGVTAHDHYQLAWDVWRTFGLPLATVWFVEETAADGTTQPRFVGIDPLPLHELTDHELRLLGEVSQRPMSP